MAPPAPRLRVSPRPIDRPTPAGSTLADKVAAALRRAKVAPADLAGFVFVSQADGSLKLEPRDRAAARFEANDRALAWLVGHEPDVLGEAVVVRGGTIQRVPIDGDDEGT
jgi:hypothetical protein